MFKKFLTSAILCVILFLGSTSLAQHGHEGGGHPGVGNHQVYGGRPHTEYQHRDAGRFIERGGYFRGRPYYGGLTIYNGVNIYPCVQYDFVNGYCYPYDYYYYPEWYSGFRVGINIR